MEQKGSMLLKVMSIIMMVGGILGAVGSFFVALFAAIGQVALSSADVQSQLTTTQSGKAGMVMGLLWVGVVVLIAGAVIEIIAGVKGKNNWNNPAMAKTLMIWGIVCAIVSTIGTILFSTGSGSFQVFSALTGLVVPVLYIIGTVQLKNQA